MSNRQNLIATYFDDIIDIISDGIYISDGEGRTLKVNKMYEQLTGLKQTEIADRLVTDLQREGKFNVVLNPEIVRTGEHKTQVQTTKVGRTVVLDGYPVFDNKKRVALVVTFVRDITKLCQLKDQLTYQQELIEQYQEQVHYSTKQVNKATVIYRSQAMEKVIQSLDMIAKTDATILLLGETGVGKGVIARRIHEQSPRSHQPFFKIDCTTIPDNLVESELFGFEPGAFSGANTKGKLGVVEMANKGTLFLDEIGELPLAMQSKLLRVLQDQEVLRVGSTQVRKVDVRFIAATNRNLAEAVKEGTFRSDLYYRLSVAVLTIPPLRERQEDILLLAKHFLTRFNGKYKKNMELSAAAVKALTYYQWPGNVREMENFIQSLVVTRNKQLIEPEDLPLSMLPAVNETEDKSLGEIMDGFEKELLRKALAAHGSIAAVAKHFQVDRVTIYRKLKKYQLSD